MTKPVIATAIVGAGPAGLLFASVARMLHARRGGDAAAWPMRLYDKRQHYVRTHRLRMAPAPYLAIQRDLADARFDAFVDFLRGHEFRPEVNVLEERMEALAADLGVQKEVLAVGAGAGDVGLGELRGRFEGLPEDASSPSSALVGKASGSCASSHG